jgi:hypothetical protein
MLIIFGFRRYVLTLAHVTGVCSQCHNPAAHRIIKSTRKFTLFFIPLFPVSTKYYSSCTFCGLTTQLDDASRDAALAAAASEGPSTVPVEPSPQITTPAQVSELESSGGQPGDASTA